MSPRRSTVSCAPRRRGAASIAAPAALAAGPDLTTTVSATPEPGRRRPVHRALDIAVSNIGNQTAHNVVVKSFMPAKTQYVPRQPRLATRTATSVKCPIGDLVASGNENLEVVLRLTDFSAATTIQNHVTAHTSDTDADSGNDGSHTNINVYNDSHDHHVTISKAEQHISLPGGSGIQSFHLELPQRRRHHDRRQPSGSTTSTRTPAPSSPSRSSSSTPRATATASRSPTTPAGRPRASCSAPASPARPRARTPTASGHWHQHDVSYASGVKSVTKTSSPASTRPSRSPATPAPTTTSR